MKSGGRFLSDGELSAYRRDGYLCVPGLFSAREAAEIRDWADALARLAPERGGFMRYSDEEASDAGVSLLSRIEYFRNGHARFRRVMEDERILGRLRQLLREPALLFKDKINYKPPGGSGFKPHQDAQAGWSRYCAVQVTALVSLDAATLENGCLEIAPGRHLEGLLGEPWKPLDGAALESLRFRALPMQPGDACFFDAYAPHRSGPNRRAAPRRVLYLTYNPVSQGDHYEAYFTDKRASYPPDAEREPGREYRYRV